MQTNALYFCHTVLEIRIIMNKNDMEGSVVSVLIAIWFQWTKTYKQAVKNARLPNFDLAQFKEGR